MPEILSYQADYRFKILERKPISQSKKLSRVYVEIEKPMGKTYKSHLMSKFPACNPRPGPDSSQSNEYCQKIVNLAEAGIPVVPFVCVVSDKEVLIPDLTRDGGIILDKHSSNLKPNNVDKEVRRLIEGFDIVDAMSQLIEIVTLADMNSIELPFDDPLAVYISPNLKPQALVLDVDWALFNNSFDSVQANRIAIQTTSYNIMQIKEEFLSK